jgi:hypothetical protein
MGCGIHRWKYLFKGYKILSLHVLKILFEKDMGVQNFETTKVPILGAIWM